ncbi:condensin-2 complex subunit D3 [Tanacetum coccineum]
MDESSEMEEESAVKGRVTQAVKHAQIQNTIPMFIELKRLLESKNSRAVFEGVQDTFRVLSCKEMKIPTNKGASLESSEMEEESVENAVK